MDQSLSGWRITPPTDRKPVPVERFALGAFAVTVLRTTGLLVLATLAVLVLLPAMIAAQPTFLG